MDLHKVSSNPTIEVYRVFEVQAGRKHFTNFDARLARLSSIRLVILEKDNEAPALVLL